MMTRILLFILFLPSLFPAGSWAIDQKIRFNRLDVSDGLSSNEITCVLKDSKGFMWFGTTSGLNSFDGYEFCSYSRKENGQSSGEERISSLAQTSDGKIWITYYDGQIGIYDPYTSRFITTDEVFRESGIGHTLSSVFVDSQKHLFFTTSNGDFYEYDPISKNTHLYSLTEGQNRICDIGDTEDRLYVVHSSGKIQGIDKKTGKCVFEDDYLATYAASQPFYMFIDSEGDLWFFLNPSCSDGVFHLIPGTGTWSRYSVNTPVALSSSLVRDVSEAPDGKIWIATDHGGINILDKKTGRVRYLKNNPFDPTSLSQNSVICLYRDDTGIMWAGTYKNGVNYYHESIFKFQTIRYPLTEIFDTSNNDYNCVLEDKSGDLWIGTSGNGLLRYNRESGTYTRYRSDDKGGNTIRGDVVISLAKDSSGNIWIGTYLNGLDCFDGKRFTHYKATPSGRDGLSDNSIYSLYADKQDRLWIGTLKGGLNCLDLSSGKWNHYRSSARRDALSSDAIFSLSGDEQGNILIGTSAGVNKLSPDNGEITRFEGTKDGKFRFTDRIINVVFSDSRGLLWIGSDHGLHIYDPLNDRMHLVNQSTGLPDNSVMSILEDELRTIWVGTKNGLLNIIPGRDADNVYQFNVNIYDENEGVQGRVFNVNSACRMESGELAFGGTAGLTFVAPSRIRYNGYAPPAVITGLFINNTPIKAGASYEGHVLLEKDISMTGQIVLNANERNFALNISSCCFFLPEKNRYAYKMEGYDKKWTEVDATGRRVTYTNLNPGTYTFLVTARNNDGIWSKEVTRLRITLLPPFWASGWAIGFYVIGGLLLVYGAISLLFYIQSRKMREEQERASIRQQHEVDEMKLRFFTNVSHEFRTPLTLILTPLERLIKTEQEPETQQVLRLIHRNADRLLKLVNQLLDFRKIDAQGDSLVLSSGDIVPFVRDVAYSFKELSGQKRIHFTFSPVFTSLSMKFDTDKVFKIVSNLLSNAFKFTPEGGTITLTLRLLPDTDGQNKISIEVSDNGSGIPADKQEAIFDRFYQVPASGKGNPGTGTGIGLHLCREFVRMHQGSISVKSQPGEGSTFTVILPVIPMDNQDIISTPEETLDIEISLTEQEVAESSTNSSPVRSTILIVDDNTDFREFMKLSLEGSGPYQVLTASDGEEAWGLIPEELPDMVISDVMMPVMDGIALCRHIKNDIRTSHIPVILLTAKSAIDNELSGLEAGADDYIGKPFNMDALLLKIQHLVDLKARMQKTFIQSSTLGIALTEVQASSLDEELMRKAIAYIEEQMANPELSVERLSREMGMSRVNFYKKTLSIIGKSPVELIRVIRLKHAAQLLEKSQLRVNEVALECGFNDVKLFRKYFKDEFGVLPSDYQESRRR